MERWRSVPNIKEVRADWRIVLDKEIDVLRSLDGSESNSIKGPTFIHEGVNFMIELWECDACKLTVDCNITSPKKETFHCQCRLVFSDGKTVEVAPVVVSAESRKYTRMTFNVSKQSLQPYFNIRFHIRFYSLEGICTAAEKIVYKTKPVECIVSSFQNAFENGTLTDCVLKVNDREIRAHRFVLGAQSKVFEAMFSHEATSEYKTGEVNMQMTTFNAVEAMLEYIYGGSVEKIRNCAADVFELADRYQIESLKVTCLEIFKESMSVEDFCRYAALAALHSSPTIDAVLAEFFKAHRRMLDTHEWIKFKAENPAAACKVYEMSFDV